MNLTDHTTLWCAATLRFWDRFDPACCVHRKRYPDLKSGDPVPRYGNVATADEFLCEAITLHTPDWQESARYTRMDGKGYRFNAYRGGSKFRGYTGRSKHGGHNWYGVARIDITFSSPDLPWYYWGVLYTGGNNDTCKLRRLKSTHQLITTGIPADATFTPLDHGICRAEWKRRHPCRQGWENRTTRHTGFCFYTPGHGWSIEPTHHAAIRAKTLRRLNLAA